MSDSRCVDSCWQRSHDVGGGGGGGVGGGESSPANAVYEWALDKGNMGIFWGRVVWDESGFGQQMDGDSVGKQDKGNGAH